MQLGLHILLFGLHEIGWTAPLEYALFPNHSDQQIFDGGSFPVALKTASITLRLKKPNMDDTDVRSFRPISNQPVVSKLVERLVVKRLINYLTTNESFAFGKRTFWHYSFSATKHI